MTKTTEVLCDIEVAVVGGGVMGCSTAYYLALAGVPVVLFEKASQVGQEASGVNAGGVRQHGRDPAEMPLAIAAIKMWKELEEELDFDLEYRPGGHLRLASSERELEILAESVRNQHRLGLHDIVLLDEKEVRELVPKLSLKFVGATYCYSDGHANPHRVCPAFARAATRAGATIHVNTEVTDIDVLCDHEFVLHTSRGLVHARYVVNCAGAWAGRIARTVGVELPVQVKYWQSMVTEPVPPFLRPVLTWPKASSDSGGWKNLNLKQLAHGQLLISGAWVGDGNLHSRQRTTRYEGVTGSSRDFVRVFRHLEGITLQRAWVGIDGHPPDNVVCMGIVPEVPGFLLGGPGSGHGFALGPIVGKLLTELIATGKASVPIDGLSIERFRVRQPEPVAVTVKKEGSS